MFLIKITTVICIGRIFMKYKNKGGNVNLSNNMNKLRNNNSKYI